MAAAPGKQNASCWRLALPFFCLLLPLQWQGAVGMHMSLLEATGAPTLFLRGSSLLERAGDLAPGNYSSWLGVAEMLLFPKLHFMYEMKGDVPALLHKARLVFQEEIAPGAGPASAESVQANHRQLYFRPVSMTLYAVMFLTIVGLMVHMSLSIARNADELSGNFQISLATQTLTVASRVTAFVPMLCMLFVSCRMYVLAQTNGLGEPQPWVKACMLTATLGMLAQLVVVVLLPGFARGPKEATYDMLPGQAGHMQVEEVSVGVTSPKHLAPQASVALAEPEVEPGDDGEEEDGIHIATGDVTDVHPAIHRVRFRDDTWAVRSAFVGLQIFSMLLLYGGIIGVLLGMGVYPHTRAVSPAIICTAILAKVYFLVHLKLWVGRTFHEEGLLKHIGLGVSTQARKAPMFCMLFLWMRMRAMELDPPAGMPSGSMIVCFYVATAAFIAELVFTGTVVALGGKPTYYYGMRFYRGDVKWPEIGQAGCALVSYISLIILTVGTANMIDTGTGAIPPVSTTGKCTLVLAGTYFTVALGQTCLMLAEALLGKEFAKRVAMFHDTLVAAGVSLSLAPAVCILFTATRMRALQITQNQGEPPGWAQDCIMMCTFAICLQSICCLVMPIFIGSATNIDEDGNPDYDLRPMIGAYAVTMVKYIALMMLYGGIFSICMAVLTMTPETANAENRALTSSKALLKALGITSVIFFISLLLSSAKVVGLAVKFAIEACDTAVLGVKITVRHCALSIFKGYVKINDLQIQQPPVGNWEDDCIAKVKLALVKINLWRMLTSLGEEVEIENVGLDGLHVNFEKPNAHMSEKNSNMEYILNKVNENLQTVGMDLDTMTAAASTASPRETVKDGKQTAQQPAKDASADRPPQIILHKIKIKDIKIGCRVKEVPVISTFSFRPTLPSLEFNDVQKEVCGGRDVMEPEKLVALIVKAIARKICDHIVKQIPRQIAEATKEKAKATGSRIMGSIKSLVTSH